MSLPIHDLATAFPVMSDDRLAELTDDIRRNGLREPITLYESQILDGRNRYAACEAAGVAPRFDEYDGDDPRGYVVSLNLHRRHLTESQRAMVAAKFANLEDGQRADRVGPSIEGATTQSEAADLLNVGRASVERAKKVQRDGTPELAAVVEAGGASVSAAADVAELPPEEQREVVARGEREILKAAKKIRAEKAEKRRAERTEKLRAISANNVEMQTGEGVYPVIYCDPPWRYEHIETESRAIENQYPTMALEEIKTLPVPAAEHCVLFMWATSPKLAESLEVVTAWGFTYRTCAVWVKDKIGMGYYFRQRHELLLVATRGEPGTPLPGARADSIIEAPRLDHSAKPHEVYGLIESMYPDLPRIELFARSRRDGWAAWGNQASA